MRVRANLLITDVTGMDCKSEYVIIRTGKDTETKIKPSWLTEKMEVYKEGC